VPDIILKNSMSELDVLPTFSNRLFQARYQFALYLVLLIFNPNTFYVFSRIGAMGSVKMKDDGPSKNP
jgi:hypothetical protein